MVCLTKCFVLTTVLAEVYAFATALSTLHSFGAFYLASFN